MANLALIINSAETIAAAFQPSIDAAFTELEAAFGFWPIVLAPNGGARTAAECDALGTSHLVSDHWEDAINRAAVDIDNQREFRNKDEALFLSILAKHGWHNMTVSGVAFPTEPWHFAKHGATTANNGALIPIDNTEPRKKKPVPFNIVKQSTLDTSGHNVPGKSQWATLGECVGPIVYTRTPANDPGPVFNTLYGAHTPLSDATWDFFIASYTPKP